MTLNRRAFVLGTGSIAVTGILAGCFDSGSDGDDDGDEGSTTGDEPNDDGVDTVDADEAAAESDDESWEPFQNIEPFETAELELETLTAETPHGTLEAQAWPNTWVGEVTDDLFVGIRVADVESDQPREVTAYLCDNDLWILTDGEMEDDRAALSDDSAEIEFSLIEDAITGTVTLSGEEPIEFTAYPATGDSGVYVAESQIDEVEISARWIVQEDGRQRGANICCEWPPTGTGPPICRHCKQLN